MDIAEKTFIYNGTHYVQSTEPANLEAASNYLGKAVTFISDAANYINGCVASYVAPVSNRIAELQASILPDTMKSALAREVSVKGVGSATLGTIAAGATVAAPTVVPVLGYLWQNWGRSSELKQIKAQNNEALRTALQQAGRDSNAAFTTPLKQIKTSDIKTRKHEKNAEDRFFSFKNMLKHSVTVLAPFCVLPQVGFTVAATAALAGITTRAVTHILNRRAEAKLCAEERADTDALRLFNHELDRRLSFEDVLIERNLDLGRKQGELETAQEQLQVAQNSVRMLQDEVEEVPVRDEEMQALREQLAATRRNLGIAEALMDVDDEAIRAENMRLRQIERDYRQLQEELDELAAED
ncbi:hypothetical protein [Endozoicomonas numazuensis]|uniref:Uncharacterized protein n=1 Tax=Endozoicomonas numazuensis TaxID=1137799 RepID=A0A081NDH0_9GAMM|nr:hypothetical protein [Endozoicomonas numazuensis]KEQ16493.1 hypothetical protein GZ78_21815 [Endozoicomonas numazuensis]